MKFINDEVIEKPWVTAHPTDIAIDNYWYEITQIGRSSSVHWWHKKDLTGFEPGNLLCSLKYNLCLHETPEIAFLIDSQYQNSHYSFGNNHTSIARSFRHQKMHTILKATPFIFLEEIVLRDMRQKDIFASNDISGYYAVRNLIKVLVTTCYATNDYDKWTNLANKEPMPEGKEQIGWLIANPTEIKFAIDRILK